MPEIVRVHGCDNPQRRGDVVFVHGLNGDPRDYWGALGSHWPAWLGDEFPDVGIWSLGYENAAFKPRMLSVLRFFFRRGFAMPLVDRAKSVLLSLENQGIGKKPLVFITHSMGGLLIKQLLRTASEKPEGSRERTLLEQTRGVCFIATPHMGSDLSKWVSYFKTLLGTTVAVAELAPHLPHLRDLTSWYRDFVQRHPIKTMTFFEMKPVPPGMFLVVDPGDADPGVPLAGLYPLDEDHRTICKPKSKSSDIHLKTVEFIRDRLTFDDAQHDSKPVSTQRSEESTAHEAKPEFEEKLKVSLRGYGALNTAPPFGTGEPKRLEIDLTIVNIGRSPVFIVAAAFKDKTGNKYLGFQDVCSEDEPLQPGGRRKGKLKLLYHEPYPVTPRHPRTQEQLFQHNSIAYILLMHVCQPSSGFHIETALGTHLVYPAVEVCDEGFLGWPYLLPPKDIVEALGKKTLKDFQDEERAAWEKAGVKFESPQNIPNRQPLSVEISSFSYQESLNRPDDPLFIITPYPRRYNSNIAITNSSEHPISIKSVSVEVGQRTFRQKPGAEVIRIEPHDYKQVDLTFPVEDGGAAASGDFVLVVSPAVGEPIKVRGNFPLNR